MDRKNIRLHGRDLLANPCREIVAGDPASAVAAQEAADEDSSDASPSSDNLKRGMFSYDPFVAGWVFANSLSRGGTGRDQGRRIFLRLPCRESGRHLLIKAGQIKKQTARR
jgi:hypothetical protein